MLRCMPPKKGYTKKKKKKHEKCENFQGIANNELRKVHLNFRKVHNTKLSLLTHGSLIFYEWKSFFSFSSTLQLCNHCAKFFEYVAKIFQIIFSSTKGNERKRKLGGDVVYTIYL
jgi:hypothetical protein